MIYPSMLVPVIQDEHKNGFSIKMTAEGTPSSQSLGSCGRGGGKEMGGRLGSAVSSTGRGTYNYEHIPPWTPEHLNETGP